MNEVLARSYEQIERELEYYRAEYNALGARMVRIQEQQSNVTREARRSKIVARLVREAYAIGGWDLTEAQVGEPILSIVADSSICDQAMFLISDPDAPDMLNVEHVLGKRAEGQISIPNPPDFLFTSANQAACPIGKLLGELIGEPFLLWAYNAGSGRAVLLGKRTEGNIHRPFEAGDREVVEVALAVYEDVLLRKRAEAVLRKARQVAEEANDARARFLANLSHELRTPLNAIIGFAKLLMQNTNGARAVEESEEYAGLILDAGQRLGSLAKDILDFSALSHARPQLRIDWIPIEYLLYNAERSVMTQTAQSGVQIKILPLEARLEAAIDYDRFRQVLSNLLGNALKFTPAGGCVTIGAARGENNGFELTIRDTGIGISEADIPRVLEPFVQLDDSTAQGAGLGLPIASQLVEAHGGTFRIESKRGEGTVVIISLPANTARLNG
jgi:signal transduction histidine kinase